MKQKNPKRLNWGTTGLPQKSFQLFFFLTLPPQAGADALSLSGALWEVMVPLFPEHDVPGPEKSQPSSWQGRGLLLTFVR